MEDYKTGFFESSSIFSFLKLFTVLCLGFLIILFFVKLLPGPNFSDGKYLTIEKGQGVLSVAKELKEEQIIKSPFLFHLSIIILGNNQVLAGTYSFEERETVISVARRVSKGDFNLNFIKVTVPEGFSNTQIANLLDSKIPNFSKEEFLSLVEGKSGYLFPDTYFFLPNEDVQKIVNLMEENFETKTIEAKKEILKSGKSFEDVIKMASIIEREAKTEEERYMISGILWKRIAIGMPLQVDATFAVINGKGSSQLSLEDLKEDSPYNLYTRLGLPPTPIVNPGLSSIIASANPTTSPYLYYLHGDDGVIRYSRTHDEHVFNKAKYIK